MGRTRIEVKITNENGNGKATLEFLTSRSVKSVIESIVELGSSDRPVDKEKKEIPPGVLKEYIETLRRRSQCKCKTVECTCGYGDIENHPKNFIAVDCGCMEAKGAMTSRCKNYSGCKKKSNDTKG